MDLERFCDHLGIHRPEEFSRKQVSEQYIKEKMYFFLEDVFFKPTYFYSRSVCRKALNFSFPGFASLTEIHILRLKRS